MSGRCRLECAGVRGTGLGDVRLNLRLLTIYRLTITLKMHPFVSGRSSFVILRSTTLLETAFAQIHFAASVVFGLPFAPWSLDRIADALLATRHEFGAIGADGAEFVSGPPLDDETRRDVQIRRFRTQAVRGTSETPYYQSMFGRLGLDPATL